MHKAINIFATYTNTGSQKEWNQSKFLVGDPRVKVAIFVMEGKVHDLIINLLD